MLRSAGGMSRCGYGYPADQPALTGFEKTGKTSPELPRLPAPPFGWMKSDECFMSGSRRAGFCLRVTSGWRVMTGMSGKGVNASRCAGNWFTITISALLIQFSPAAETAKTDPVEIINHAYAKIDGFQATYHSAGDNKSLDATVALDKKTGLSFFRLEAASDGRRMEGKNWSTQAGTVFMSGGNDLFRLDVIANMRILFRDLKSVAEVDDGAFDGLTPAPCFYLEKDRIAAQYGFGSTTNNPWFSLVKGGVLKSADENRIVVETANCGQVTFDAKSGVMIRQVLKGAENEDRILELSELKLNPGGGAILEVTSAWDTDGAKSIPAAAFAGQIRSKLFRSFIDLVDKGDMKPAELETFFSEKREPIRELVADLVSDDIKLLNAPFWKDLLDQKELRKKLAQPAPGGRMMSEEEIDLMFLDRKLRASFRDTLVRRILDDEDAWKEIIHEFLKPGKDGNPEPKTDNGRTAEAFVERYLAKTLYGIVIDLKLDEFWGKPL